MPCATELRRMWTIGSLIPSRITRSSSVSAPVTTSSTSVPLAAAMSRTARGNVPVIDASGSVRISIAVS